MLLEGVVLQQQCFRIQVLVVEQPGPLIVELTAAGVGTPVPSNNDVVGATMRPVEVKFQPDQPVVAFWYIELGDILELACVAATKRAKGSILPGFSARRDRRRTNLFRMVTGKP